MSSTPRALPGWKGYDQDRKGSFMEYRHRTHGVVLRIQARSTDHFSAYPKGAEYPTGVDSMLAGMRVCEEESVKQPVA